MATPPRMTKEERDKTRQRAGNKHRKRLHVLRNPAKLAFKGWEDVPDPWSFDDCANYIEWCHIDKVFPEERHNFHRRFHKANLKHCVDEEFTNRCIEVFQVLYDVPNVTRNEVHLFIARGVHAEVKLNKRVDWSTLKTMGENVNIPTPENGFIPRGVRRYPEGGLGKKLTQVQAPPTYDTSDSSTDNDSDGSRVPVVVSHRTQQQRAKKRRAARTTNEVLPENVVEGQVAPTEEPTVGIVDVTVAANRIQSLLTEVNDKNAELHSLYDDVHKLKEEIKEKDNIINQQQREMEVLRHALEAATLANGGQDPRGEAQGPSNNSQIPLEHAEVGATMDTQDDSLSFEELPTNVVAAMPVDQSTQLTDALANNLRLKNQLHALMEQYYQWKMACIFSVDRTRQMVEEFKKIDNNYGAHNQERVFGLTSWALVDDLFNMDEMATIDIGGGPTTIDWSKHAWDFKNAVGSAIDHQGNPLLLWPNPSTFVHDGTTCPICLNPFGPEGGMHLGTCEHLYHPFCLISLMIVRRRCSLCKAPFHERLYELFGLVPYMPPHWEFNAENAPDHSQKWGTDLVWSWKLNIHSLDKQHLCTEWGWEREPAQIVEVCHHLVPLKDNFSQGRRNFFFQCFNGHWNEAGQYFQFGPHPRGWLWGVDGVRITDDHGMRMGEDIGMPNPAELAQLSESEWRETFRNEGMDYLLEQHSPGTLQCLESLKQSQILRALLEEDGPARRTRSAVRRLCLGSDEDLPVRAGTHDNEAGPSGSASSPMNTD